MYVIKDILLSLISATVYCIGMEENYHSAEISPTPIHH